MINSAIEEAKEMGAESYRNGGKKSDCPFNKNIDNSLYYPWLFGYISEKNGTRAQDSDPVYSGYINSLRACIDTYGAQNTIHALSEACRLESEDSTHQERQVQYLAAVSDMCVKLYYDIEKL